MTLPAPQQALCAFPECTATGCFGFREPGIANLAHRRPDAPEVWLCGAHQEHGPQMLAVRVEAAMAAVRSQAQAQGGVQDQQKLDAGAKARATELVSKARRDEGLLL